MEHMCSGELGMDLIRLCETRKMDFHKLAAVWLALSTALVALTSMPTIVAQEGPHPWAPGTTESDWEKIAYERLLSFPHFGEK